ncbi:hypothetical protein [Streptomyces decoyicus]
MAMKTLSVLAADPLIRLVRGQRPLSGQRFAGAGAKQAFRFFLFFV